MISKAGEGDGTFYGCIHYYHVGLETDEREAGGKELLRILGLMDLGRPSIMFDVGNELDRGKGKTKIPTKSLLRVYNCFDMLAW